MGKHQEFLGRGWEPPHLAYDCEEGLHVGKSLVGHCQFWIAPGAVGVTSPLPAEVPEPNTVTAGLRLRTRASLAALCDRSHPLLHSLKKHLPWSLSKEKSTLSLWSLPGQPECCCWEHTQPAARTPPRFTLTTKASCMNFYHHPGRRLPAHRRQLTQPGEAAALSIAARNDFAGKFPFCHSTTCSDPLLSLWSCSTVSTSSSNLGKNISSTGAICFSW